jgi:hypothetical protein
MFLLQVKMISSSILEMQRGEWPETLKKYLSHQQRAHPVL